MERRVSDAERRNTTLRSLLQGSMTPRRRTGRRASDHQAVVDWHDPHLMFLSVAMLMLSVADAFLTVSLLAVGAIETNPLLAAVLQERPELFAVTKLALTGFSVIVLVAVARRRLLRFIPVQSVFQFLVLAYLALVIYELWLIWSLR